MTDSDQHGPENGPGSPVQPISGPDGQSDSPKAPEARKSASGDPTGTGPGKDPEVFPRAYVEDLRKESQGYRTKAQKADALAQRLVVSMAARNGRMADPTDLPFDDSLLDDDGYPDEAKVTAAIDDLLARKPHLMSRKPTRTVDQGPSTEARTGGLLDAMRSAIS